MRVLNYHGVADPAEQSHHFASLFTDVDDFQEQVAIIARRCRPVSLDELAASVTNTHELPDNAVHVSFDDGYRNNLVAAEILDRHRIPWSLFAVVDAVLDGYRPWFLRLADAVEATTNVLLPDGSVFELTDSRARRRYAAMVKPEIMAAAHADQDGVVDRLLARPGMSAARERSWPLLTISELKELQSAGVEVGNHSARHRNLRRCSDADLRHEVVSSRTRLETALGVPVKYFAYPDGRHDRRVRAVVGEQHAAALATWTVRSPTSRLALRRYEPVDAHDLEAILHAPEPWYGRRWVRWNLPWRAREVAMQIRHSSAATSKAT